ncbi:NADP-dependent oxidoreductase domain-containing protein [Neohortaea acidophila]|uniref:NADP-dependent oxidoreductase domain-containing protein n=1 Tax=Neohortaea acidophila TaxID=245834 RepID=A0A6A6PFP2_9PEZI|nr:NADP-dependent oxidoreductase domain-containing protein [Neohortaea acidophila]KAF2478782.1 NADP-dependent oxidoreductase domain-containing protein [Neohortaea acidophila]
MAKIHTPIPNLKLNDGTSIPMIGYGTGTAWYKSGEESKLDQTCIDAAKMSLDLGYYHQDGAEMYKTETELGTAIKSSGVPREKLFVTTKVLRNMTDLSSALKTSLKKLQLDHVDLFLIHSPFFSDKKEEHQEKWKQMEELKAQGLCKSIGVSNYLPEQLDWILENATVPPAINQVEFHPYLQREELIKYHKAKGIATAAYGPLSAVTKGAGGPADDVLNALARKYAVSPAEISLRWCIDQDIVPITTSSKEQRLSDYLLTFRFKLTPAEIKEINEAGSKKHLRGFWTHKFDENDRR